MPWARFLFKKQSKVYARVDTNGVLLKDGALVEIKYNLNGKPYKAQPANLSDLPEGKGELIADEAAPNPAEAATETAGVSTGDTSSAASPSKKIEASQPVETLASNEVIIYADGACSGNPGPAGIGVYIRDQTGERDVSEYLGQGTNNIAELVAIQRALELCSDKSAVIKIYTDSAYSIGVLTQNWKAKANQELIAKIRMQLRSYPRVRFIKVAGHAGIPGNERADMLARRALSR
jgi:ribonuclease HI